MPKRGNLRRAWDSTFAGTDTAKRVSRQTPNPATVVRLPAQLARMHLPACRTLPTGQLRQSPLVAPEQEAQDASQDLQALEEGSKKLVRAGQEVEQVLAVVSSTGCEFGQEVQLVGEPSHVPQDDEQGKQSFVPARIEVPLLCEVLGNVPEGQLPTHCPAFKDWLGSLHDVHDEDDPSQVPQDSSHATHDPSEANVPEGQIVKHLPLLRKAPSEHAVQVTELEFPPELVASVQNRGAASQSPLSVLKRKSPCGAVPVELFGLLQTPLEESTLTQAAIEVLPVEPEANKPLPA